MVYKMTIVLLGCLCLIACSAKKATISAEATKPTEEKLDLPPDTKVVPHDVPPVLLEDVHPEYPRLAYEGGFTGYVIVKAFVWVDGTVKKARAVKTNRPSMGFEEEAVRAAYKCRYKAATFEGEPVGVWIKYWVDFRKGGRTTREDLDSHHLL